MFARPLVACTGQMFVREESRMAVRFDAACSGLAGLAHGGGLLDASRAAYGDGTTGMVKVGPTGASLGLSKLVMIHVAGMTLSDESARLPLRWEATGPGSGLFPALDADIIVTPDGDDGTALTLTGVYRPPLGMVGVMLDRAVLGRMAAATVRDFVARLAEAIADPRIRAEQGNMDPDGP